MKIVSWNVNGIRAAVKKGFLDFMKAENPDIMCIQETKAHPDQVDEMLDNYKFHYWNSAHKKGYSGTAIFSKVEPLSIFYGVKKMETDEEDDEGRVLTAEFDDFFLVNVYTPNSGRGLARLEFRKKWDVAFYKFLKNLEKSKPIILCGDLNVAHTEIDLANPKTNYNKTAGYTQTEIDGFQKYMDNDLVDSFRHFTKDPEQYTYWGYWNNLRQRNIGWRIDYFIVSTRFMKHITKSFILPDVMGSDHCPVGILLDR
jgi:exodeoxyribonuclease III